MFTLCASTLCSNTIEDIEDKPEIYSMRPTSFLAQDSASLFFFFHLPSPPPSPPPDLWSCNFYKHITRKEEGRGHNTAKNAYMYQQVTYKKDA